MSYVEFLVFLCRIAYFHYEKTPYRNELLYLKLDHLMQDFCAFLNLQKWCGQARTEGRVLVEWVALEAPITGDCWV